MRAQHISRILFAVLLSSGVAAADPPIIGTQCELKFHFDSSALPPAAREDLARVAELALGHPELLIILDGNADSVGSVTYNMGLSIRRAAAVRTELVNLGVDESRIVLAAFGEDGKRRQTFAGDRRVTVWTTRASVQSIIGRTFKGHGTAVKWHKPMTVAELRSSVPIARR
jgi:outer membrane protein OmpA-like peptidoglycan-associated protein